MKLPSTLIFKILNDDGTPCTVVADSSNNKVLASGAVYVKVLYFDENSTTQQNNITSSIYSFDQSVYPGFYYTNYYDASTERFIDIVSVVYNNNVVSSVSNSRFDITKYDSNDIYDFVTCKTKFDTTSNTAKFYTNDINNPFAEYKCYDDSGTPSVNSVYKMVKE